MSDDRNARAIQRVCIVPGWVGGGGTTRVMLNLAEAFVEAGMEVDLFVGHDPGSRAGMVPDGVRLTIGRDGSIRSIPALVRYLRQRRPDALVAAHHAPNVVSVIARALARVPTKVLVTVQNDSSSLPANARNVRFRLLRQATRLTYPRAHAIIAVSKGVADDAARVLRVPRDRISVVYNPVISDKTMEDASGPIDPEWPASSEEMVVLGAGRLVAQKDFATLVRAFAIIRGSIRARLIILGEGKERPALERLIAELGLRDVVSLLGLVPSAIPYMKRASVFVLSSRWEGLPLVLVEALAVGTPVVSTDCPSGPAEILDGGRYGKLVPVADHKALAQATLETLADPPRAADLIERGRAFSAKRAADQYLALMVSDRQRS